MKMTPFEQRMKVVFWTIIELCGTLLLGQYFFGFFSDFMNAKNDLLVILGIVGIMADLICFLWLSIHIFHKQYHKFISIPQDNDKDQNVPPTL